MADLGEALLVVLVVALLAMTANATYRGVRRVRRLRRRWRAAVTGARRGTSPAVVSASSPGWWAAQRDRQRMWRAVVRAERAVAAAASTGVPVGELPRLTRQLRASAAQLDAGLAGAPPPGCGDDDLRRQARDVAAAADDIARATSSAVAGESRTDTERLVTAVREELAAVRHGWQAATRR